VIGKTKADLPQISQMSADQENPRILTTKDTRSTPLSQAQSRSGQATEHKERTFTNGHGNR
jgi:hypothetical protein